MKKTPPAKLSAILILLVAITILVQIPVVLANSPKADADGPYPLPEGETKGLDGIGSENVENYNWIITNDPTDEAYLTGADTGQPTFHAPEEVTGGDKTVDVKLTVTDENGISDSDTTTVKIRDLLRARPGGPYEVVEENTVTLDGSNSSGMPDDYSWVITQNVSSTESAYLTDADEPKAELHAPAVDEDETVVVRLTVYKGDNSHSKETEVEIKDPVISDPNGPYSPYENDTTLLYGNGSSGSDSSEIETYHWTRIDDPTENAYLTSADKENATFHAPEEIDGDKTVTVRLLVEDSNGKSDQETVKIKVKDKLVARPGGPYQVVEENKIELDGSESSGYIDNYSWVITSDPTGIARLEGSDTATPLFKADGSVTQSKWVKIKLTVTDENNNKSSAETKVKVLDDVVSNPGGPYQVVENQSRVLDGTGSEGDDLSYKWKILEDPTGNARLTDKDTAAPTFHAIDGLENNKTVKVQLTVTDGDNDSDSATVDVIVKDALVARPGGPYHVMENNTLELNGSGSTGDIDNFLWSIFDDPTGEATLTENNTSTPTFDAPDTVDTPTTVVVKLLVSNELDTHYKKTDIEVRPLSMPPGPPENLKVEGKVNPSALGVPNPLFSSGYVVVNDASATKAEIQLGTSPGENDVWIGTREDISVSPGNRFEIEYEGDPLEPENTYYWRMRFYANDTWGSWSTEDAQFTMDTLKSIINTNQTPAVAEIVLDASPADAASTLMDANLNSSAKVLEEAVAQDILGTSQILDEMSPGTLAEFILEVSQLPETPEKAAQLLGSLSTQKAGETVSELINQEEFEELDEIFQNLSETERNNIFKSEKISDSERKDLYSNLSEGVRQSLSYSPGGIGLLLVVLIVVIGIVAVLGLLFLTGRLEFAEILVLLKLREEEAGEGEAEGKGEEKPSRKKKWAKLIKKFLNSGKREAGVKTEIPVDEALESVRSTIRELGGEDVVGAEKREGKVYLVRKS